jgi:hypothetical protein
MQARRLQCSEPSRTSSLLLWCPLLPSMYRSCSLPPLIFPVTASIPVPSDRSAGPAIRTYFTRSTPTSGPRCLQIAPWPDVRRGIASVVDLQHESCLAPGRQQRRCSARFLSAAPGSGIDDGAERIPDPATPTSQQARNVWSGWVIASTQDDAISGCPAAAAMV